MKNITTITDTVGDELLVGYSPTHSVYKTYNCVDNVVFYGKDKNTVDKFLALFKDLLIEEVEYSPDPLILAYKVQDENIFIVLEGTEDKRRTIYLYWGSGLRVSRKITEIYKIMNSKKVSEEKIPINILYPSRGSFVSKYRELSSPMFNIEDCYDEEAVEFFEKLKKNAIEGGISLIYGAPGTGKTTFIKFLAREFTHDEAMSISYVPVSFLEENKSSNLLEFLDGEGSQILVLEDAESIVMEQDQRSSFTSLLLNTTDGILGDICNLHIIVTFNCKFAELDPALVRRGRLKGMYEFKALSDEKAESLRKKLEHNIDSNLSCDIFNPEDNGAAKKERAKIGF